MFIQAHTFDCAHWKKTFDSLKRRGYLYYISAASTSFHLYAIFLLFCCEVAFIPSIDLLDSNGLRLEPSRELSHARLRPAAATVLYTGHRTGKFFVPIALFF